MSDDDDNGSARPDATPDTAKRRVVGSPFPKGRSGNPGGRPRTAARTKQAMAKLALTSPRDIKKINRIIETHVNKQLENQQQPSASLLSIWASNVHIAYEHFAGKAVARVAGESGPLIPTGAATESGAKLFAILDRLRAQQAAAAEGQPTTTEPASAAPAAPGEAGRPS